MDSQTPSTWSEKIFAAHRRREGILLPATDTYRLVDGDGDSLGGLAIDVYAGHWLLQTRPGFVLPAFPPEFGYRSLFLKILSARDRQAPIHLAGEPITEPFLAGENGMRFWINFQAGYSQGLFLDQRENRDEIRRTVAGQTVLNTFAYTCAFGVAAALGGARTVNVDLSRHYLDWGRRNYEANGLDPSRHDFIYGDALAWLRRFARRGERFDTVVLDPPTFSRDRKAGVFRIEEDYGMIVDLACAVLTKRGRLLCCANTHRLSAAQFRAILRHALPARPSIIERRMPPDFPGSDYLKSFWVEW
ncbi:MAG TPA: class I SAM-dependent rRNA methyltransferase [Chthoniobacterales bacterium]